VKEVKGEGYICIECERENGAVRVKGREGANPGFDVTPFTLALLTLSLSS